MCVYVYLYIYNYIYIYVLDLDQASKPKSRVKTQIFVGILNLHYVSVSTNLMQKTRPPSGGP